MMVKHAGLRSRRARVAVLAVFASASLVLGGLQSANALVAPVLPNVAQSSPSQVIEIDNPALADQPQLSVDGSVLVIAVDNGSDSRTEYSVQTDAGTVRIDGELDQLTTGSTFTGTVALPEAVTEKLASRYSARVESSAQDPIGSESF